MPTEAQSTVQPGPMERAIRKWDGDVFHGHEPEAWADLRLRAREQDGERARLIEVNAVLFLALGPVTAEAGRMFTVYEETEIDNEHGEAMRAILDNAMTAIEYARRAGRMTMQYTAAQLRGERDRLREVNAQLLAALEDARALIEDASIEWPNAQGLTDTDATIAGIERSEWQITLDRILAAIAKAGA